MRLRDKGYTILELAFTIGVIALISTAALLVIFQIFRSNERSNDYVTSLRQVENAGYWISRDAQMAQSVTANELTLPDFLIINWTEWDASGDSIYHSVRYFFEDITDDVGTLKRHHWSSGGANEQTPVARYIYCNSDNVTYTSYASYHSPVLEVRITSLCDDALESREYQIVRRVNY